MLRIFPLVLLLALAWACTEEAPAPGPRSCSTDAVCPPGELCLESQCAPWPYLCPAAPCPRDDLVCQRGRCIGADEASAEGEGEGGSAVAEGEGEGATPIGEGEGEGGRPGNGGQGEGEGEGSGTVAEGEGEGASPAEGEGEQPDRPPPELGTVCDRHVDCTGGENPELTCKGVLEDGKMCTHRCHEQSDCPQPEDGSSWCCFDTGRGQYCAPVSACRDPLVCDVDEDCTGGRQCFDRPDLGEGERRCHGTAGTGEPCGGTFYDCNPDVSERCLFDSLLRRFYCSRGCAAGGEEGACGAWMCCGDALGFRRPEDYACLLGPDRCNPFGETCQIRDDARDQLQVPDDACETAQPITEDGVEGMLCGNDEDWSYVDAVLGQSIFATVSWDDDPEQTDPRLEIRTVRCGFMAESTLRTCAPPNEVGGPSRCSVTAALMAPDSGRYVIRLSGPRGEDEVNYDLQVQLGCEDDDQCRSREEQRVTCQGAGVSNGICVDGFPCAGDGDCVGSRVCNQADLSCVEVCVEDIHDRGEAHNNACGGAASVVGAGLQLEALTVCPGDEDWFVVGMAAGDGLEVNLEHVRSSGQLNAAIFAPNCLASLVAATGPGDTKQARLDQVDQAGNYFIRVAGADPSVQNDYDLEISVREGGFCVDDVAEDDDLAAQAVPVEDLGYDAEISFADRKGCEEDDDWFSIGLSAGETLSIHLDFEGGEDRGNLDLALYGPGLEVIGLGPIATASSEEDGEELHHQALADGEYFVRLSGGLDLTYLIRFSKTEAPCEDDEFEPNNSADSPVDVPVTPDEPLVRAARFCPGSDDWWRFFVPAGAGIEVQVCVADPLEGDLDIGFYEAGEDEPLAQSNQVQTPCEDIAIARVPEAGDYLVRVTAFERAMVAYQLSVVLIPPCPDDAHEPNDGKLAASDLDLGGHVGLRACTGNEDWYHIDKPQSDTLWVDLIQDPADFPLTLTLYNRTGASSLSPRPIDSPPDRPGQISTTNADTNFIPPASAYKIKVAPADPEVELEQAYNLIVRSVPHTPDCVDDDREPDNSIVRPAAVVSGSFVERVICPGNPDHYPVDLEVGQRVSATLLHDPEVGGLTLSLIGPDGVSVIEDASGADAAVALVVPAAAATRYILRVEGEDAEITNGYTLELSVD